eukprot:Lankesteria_metandrocarpae@DN5462_c1_g3_i1.p1
MKITVFYCFLVTTTAINETPHTKVLHTMADQEAAKGLLELLYGRTGPRGPPNQQRTSPGAQETGDSCGPYGSLPAGSKVFRKINDQRSSGSPCLSRGDICGMKQGDSLNDFLATACDEYGISGAMRHLEQVKDLRTNLTDVTCSLEEVGDVKMRYKGNETNCEVTRCVNSKGDDAYGLRIVQQASNVQRASNVQQAYKSRAQFFKIYDYGKCGAAILACLAAEHAVSSRGRTCNPGKVYNSRIGPCGPYVSTFRTDKYGDDGAIKLMKAAKILFWYGRPPILGKRKQTGDSCGPYGSLPAGSKVFRLGPRID